MTELELKYGCNPNQKPARIFMEQGELPLEVLNGKPGYINFMDALNSWQLVKALKRWACPCLTLSGRSILPPRGTSPPSPAPTSGPGGPTVCAPSGTGRLYPTPATGTPPASWPWRCPTASSPRTTPRKLWRS